MSDELTPEEKRLLDLVPVALPPSGFAAKVMVEERRRATRRRLLAAAAAVLLIGGAALLWPRGYSGELAASSSRTSVTLGDRGVAVAEAGAALSWTVKPDGSAAISQSAGNVFYRVEPGGAFVVSTSAGEVTVTGTCFRVEVSDVKTLLSGAIGAVAAAIMTVTVYEGRVLAAGGGAEVALAAGESTIIDPARPIAPPVPPQVAAPIGGRAPAATLAPRAPLPSNLSTDALYEAHAAVAREAEALRAEVDRLKKDLDSKSEKEPKNKFYEPSPTDLVELAQKCRLQWDTVSLSSTPPGFPVKHAEKLGLSEEERAAVEARVNAHQKALVDQIRALYVEVTGDTTGGSLAATAMLNEIEDKTTEQEHQRVFQQLSRERAGLAAPPPVGQPESPYTRLYRALTGAGNSLEASIAEELGPETARRVRDLNDGWGNKHGSSYGCPP
jgi:hypothetical protein